jgi:hypothetical protein
MKSGAEPHTSLFVRGAGLFDRVDYRLIETSEAKDRLYLMRYRAYLHGGLILPSESQRDSARFVADPEKAQRFPELPYLTLRLAYLACEYFNADTGLALVRAEHQAFYRRVCLHETIAEPRSFPNVLKKVVLMASGLRTRREEVLTRFPIMRSSAFERRMLFQRDRHSFQDAVISTLDTAFERTSIVPHS